MLSRFIFYASSRCIRLVGSSRLTTKTAVAATAISMLALMPGWTATSYAEVPAVPPSNPGTVSTSANDLSQTAIVADCSTVLDVPVRLPHCSSETLPDSTGGELPVSQINPILTLDANQKIDQNIQLRVLSQEPDRSETSVIFLLR